MVGVCSQGTPCKLRLEDRMSKTEHEVRCLPGPNRRGVQPGVFFFFFFFGRKWVFFVMEVSGGFIRQTFTQFYKHQTSGANLNTSNIKKKLPFHILYKPRDKKIQGLVGSPFTSHGAIIEKGLVIHIWGQLLKWWVSPTNPCFPY